MIRILVSGAGGDVAQGVIKALNKSPLQVDILSSCISPKSSWLHAPGVRAVVSPFAASDKYLDWLIATLNAESIDAFFPTVDGEILILARNMARMQAETDTQILCGSLEASEICADKLATISFLADHGFEHPISFALNDPNLLAKIDQIGFPLIVKPRSGRGSYGVHKIDNPTNLTNFRGDPSLLAQTYLPESGGEYTSGVYLGDDGEVKGVAHFLRQLKHGSTIFAQRTRNAEFDAQLIPMAKALGTKYLNIQTMLVNDRLVPFEFNGRLSGSTAMVSRVFNAPELFLRERVLGETVERQDSDENFVALRYLEEIYTTRDRIDALEKGEIL